MKLILAKTETAIAPPRLMRMAGFIYIVDRHTGTGSYSRKLGSYHYPRFHSYIDDKPDSLVINLHLDQKQATYEGTNRHSGEYDGEAVEGEMSRLQSMALAAGYQLTSGVYKKTQTAVEQAPQVVAAPRMMNGLGSGDFASAALKYEPKKSLWKKLFG